MYRFIKPFLLLFYLQFLFGIGGLGIYYNQDFFSTESAETGETITVTSGGLENASGPGIFLYIDVIPFVDIQVDIENSNSSYNFSTSGTLEGTLTLSRLSQYYTVRKKIIGFSIPLLAKAQLYSGAGFNVHTVTPKVDDDFITDAFDKSIEEAVLLEFSSSNKDLLIDYLKENKNTYNGFHLMVGAQAKLMSATLFANLRYTIAKDVIPG
ncbi:uncharacterized protein METZ01_LOCUS442927, partial [marine metagenome]